MDPTDSHLLSFTTLYSTPKLSKEDLCTHWDTITH